MDRTERHLRAGLVLYAAGEFHAAHEPWERRWLELADAGSDDEGDDAGTAAPTDAAGSEGRTDDAAGSPDPPDRRLLQGLIQTTAAVYHARTGNEGGANGLAESAQGYLGGLPPTHRGIALDPVLAFLERVAADPAVVERAEPVAIELDGEVPRATTASFETVVLAAEALVEEGVLDGETVAAAAEYGRADLADGRATSPFVSLLADLVDGENRALVERRLGEHVDRRDHREAGVAGLFDVDDG
jgi:hypothetical protein